jgi:hypothetical protein
VLSRLLGEGRFKAGLAYSESYVAAKLTLEELVRHALPLSDWWRRRLWPDKARNLGRWVERHLAELAAQSRPEDEPGTAMGELAWFVGLLGRIAADSEALDRGQARSQRPSATSETMSMAEAKEIVARGANLLSDLGRPPAEPAARLWAVNLNRAARTAMWRSTTAVKADAARRVFNISCRNLRWAVVDVGVDATHPAFRRRQAAGQPFEKPFGNAEAGAGTRVTATYDFTRLREVIGGNRDLLSELPSPPPENELDEIQQRLQSGRVIDWDLLEPLLRVKHDASYVAATNEHGTHVAGILGGDWRSSDPDMPSPHDLCGMCPDIELYDLRVFDQSGRGDEFAITAALQFIRHLNSHSDLQVIHGVNLSLSIDHDVRNYAVGRTPICDECDRLVASGVVVVTVAGNEGRSDFATPAGMSEGYRTVSVTDPGNAERVITVGATHRYMPHTYGVSYFSSRGPTGDGRPKPDLVAPGEKVQAPVPGGDYKAKDGTSQAAPHVSGAAALLLARHEELLGHPLQVKEILCRTATDLGRERYFQGAGMVDVLRATQAV